MSYSNIFCVRFDFGVPLEDVFPPNDIHPRLKNLFYQTQMISANSATNLGNILGCNSGGSLKERLHLKEDLIKGKLIYKPDVNPGGFFWLLRHFLGLLPLPLFPKYTNGNYYNWENLAIQCKLYGKRKNYQLDSEIYLSIERLPKANILMIYNLMDFLRKICFKYNYKRTLDKKGLVAVVKYFSSSLFLRPYMPGFISAADKFYFPLLYYLIWKWPHIQQLRKRQSLVVDEFLKIFPIPEEEINLENLTLKADKDRSVTKLTESSCQTGSSLLIIKRAKNLTEINENDEFENIYLKPFSKESFSKNNVAEDLKDTEDCVDVKESLIEDCENHEKEEVKKLPLTSCRNHSVSSIKSKYENKSLERSVKSQDNLIETEDDYLYDDDYQSSNFKLYEDIVENKTNSNLDTNSETVICKRNGLENNRNTQSRSSLKKKLSKANKSLVEIMSKVNTKIKYKHDLRKAASTINNMKPRNNKYSLLKDISTTPIAKISSLRLYNLTTESPHIKYKKLLTF